MTDPANRALLFVCWEAYYCLFFWARFLVYNGAIGGWKQPQQTIVSLLYGDAFDAIVTLDGFNELSFLTLTRLEMANHDFELLNPLAAQSSRAIIVAAITNQVQAW